jgi:hypothetical protein
MNESGVCQCGCGRPVKRARQDDLARGYKKGDFRHYIRGHMPRNGGRTTHSDGYALVLKPGHPRTGTRGYVYEHVLVMEAKIGRYLEPQEVVHHIDGDKANNAPQNLLLCKDHIDHMKVHAEAKAIFASGNKDWRPCRFCGKYDSLDNLYSHPTNYSHQHSNCAAHYAREFRRKRKERLNK